MSSRTTPVLFALALLSPFDASAFGIPPFCCLPPPPRSEESSCSKGRRLYYYAPAQEWACCERSPFPWKQAEGPIQARTPAPSPEEAKGVPDKKCELDPPATPAPEAHPAQQP